MKLLDVELTNFRCFESLKIHFDPEVNVHVFVGDNGAGKSAILDALAIGLAPIARRFGQTPGDKKRGTLDILENPRNASRGVAIFDETPPKPYCHLHFRGRPNGKVVEWDFHTPRDKSKRTKAALPKLLTNKHLHEALDDEVFKVSEHPNGDAGTLPVFAYYGTNRAVLDIPQRLRNFENAFKREAALRNALDPTSRFKEAFEWFLAMEREEVVTRDRSQQPFFKLPVLDAVRRAIHSMLPDFAEPHITTQPLHFALSRKNPDGTVTDLYAEQLSDGYRTMLALVMDFARRLAQANPKDKDPLSAEAILMIDEVDLHLHPMWQQTIVPDLQRTFPNTQLILTTHSDQVGTTLHSHSVHVIQNGALHSAPAGTYGAESKRFLEQIMLPATRNSRPPNNERVARLEKLFELIGEGRLDEAQTLADELNQEFGGNEPAIDRGKMMIENRRWEKEVGL